MTYSPVMPNMKLTAADMGVPDYGEALRKGFQTSADVYKPRTASESLLAKMLENKINQPKAQDAQGWYDLQKRGLAAETGLHSAQAQQALMDYMQNKAFYDLLNGGGSSGGAASGAPEASDSGYSDSQPSMGGQSGIDNSNNPGVSAEGPGANYGEPTVANTFPGRTGRPIAQTQTPAQQPYVGNVNQAMTGQQDNLTVLSAGDPNKEYLNQMHEQHPEWRSALKSKGYEKTSEVKYDPKTGTSSIITKYPNGKVTVQTSKPIDSGYGALTSANITKANDAIMGVTNVMPTIDKLIALADKGEIPGQVVGQYFKRDQQATYNSLSNMSGDTLAKALGFPSTDKGMEAALASIRRADGESDKHYADRLKDYRKDMMERLKNSKQFLRKGVSTSDSNQADPYGLGI